MTQKSSKMKHNHQQTIGVNCQIRSNHKLFNSLECDASIIYSKVDITQEPKLHKISTFDLISWMETWWKRTLVETNHNTRKRKSCNRTIFWRKWKSHSSTPKKEKQIVLEVIPKTTQEHLSQLPISNSTQMKTYFLEKIVKV